MKAWLKFSEYQEKAMRTASGLNKEQMKENAVLGMIGEIGECVEILKKHLYQGHPLNKQKLAEELGDVLWYVALFMESQGKNIRYSLNYSQFYYDDGMECFNELHNRFSKLTYDNQTQEIKWRILQISFFANRISNILSMDELFKKLKENPVIESFGYIGRIVEHITAIGIVMDIGIEEMAEGNIFKLMNRYPSGFEANKSVERYE